MVERGHTRNVHGVTLVMPGVGGVGAACDGVDLHGLPVPLVEVYGVVVHRLQHLLLETDATSGGIFVGRSE